VTLDAFGASLVRAARAFHTPEIWRRIQANGMRCDVGWNRPAKQYAELYRKIDDEQRRAPPPS
jgi:starch synthase